MATTGWLASSACSLNASFFVGCVPSQGFEIGSGIREGSTAGVSGSGVLGLDKLNNLQWRPRNGRAQPAARSFEYLGLNCTERIVHSRAIPVSRLGGKLGTWQIFAFRSGGCVLPSTSIKTFRRRIPATCGVNGAFWEGADSESTADLWAPSEVKEGVKPTSGSLLLNMVQDIEPLDVSTISKDASPDSTGAMKRTISGMLGLLPSDQFQVTIETSPDHLARLLVSSMMTGYTLRNAEYRLSLQRTLELALEDVNIQDHHWEEEQESVESHGPQFHSSDHHRDDGGVSNVYREYEQIKFPTELGAVSSEVANYIQHLHKKLTATSKELEGCRKSLKNAVSSSEIKLDRGLATRNDLLDYLRSLEPEKVAELSQPSNEVQDAIEEVVDGLLGTMLSKPKPSVPPFETSSMSGPWEECGPSEVVGNIPLQFQSTVTSSRDYLARLLFWCTLLGYYMRGLEYRLELSRTLSLSGDSVLYVKDDKPDTLRDWSDPKS